MGVFAKGSSGYCKDSDGNTYNLFTSTGLQYSQNKPIYMPNSTAFNPYNVETITLSSGGASPSSAVPYGITYVNVDGTGDPSTSVRLVTLGAPITGVEKTIIFDTTAAYVNTLDIDLGADVGVMNELGDSTTNRFIAFSTLATVAQGITLVGLSTALWGVKAVNSTLLFFGAATGIRALTAARTS